MGGGEYGIKKPRQTDFYVGPNGQVLPGKYRNWIGVSRRDRLLKKAKNAKLKNAIDLLYRPGSFIGDGGTASVLKFEKFSGISVSRNPQGHYFKAQETAKYISNKVLKENLSNSERKVATKILRQLQRAVLEWEGKI